MKLSKLPIPQTPNIQMPINIYILFKQWSPEGWQVIRFYISVENGLGSHVCSSVGTLFVERYWVWLYCITWMFY